MKIRTDFVTNSSSSSYIVELFLENNDPSETHKKIKVINYETGEHIYPSLKFFGKKGPYGIGASFGRLNNYADSIKWIMNCFSVLEENVDFSNCKKEKVNDEIRWCNDIIQTLRNKKMELTDFTHVICSVNIIGYGESYSETGIYDLFPDLTLDEINNDANACAEKYNLSLDSILAYKEHLENNVTYIGVTKIYTYSLYTNKYNIRYEIKKVI